MPAFLVLLPKALYGHHNIFMKTYSLQLNTDLMKCNKVLVAVLFGSSIIGAKHPGSDIDIGVVFERNSERLHDPVGVYGELYNQFAPLARKNQKLDIVYLDEAPVSLRFKAITEGDLIYIKDARAFCDYKERVMREYFDFKPVMDEFTGAFLGKV